MAMDTKDKKNFENAIDQILIVEDSPTQAEQLKYLLEKNGYRVFMAKNGREALGFIAESTPSLVISDIVMPEMNGYELCRQIKARERTKNIPVLLLTVLSNPEDVIESVSCGADSFLTKPYSEDYLLSLINFIFTNKKILSRERINVEVEMLYGGNKHFLSANMEQTLTLLISTYEAAVRKNEELTRINSEKDKLFSIIAHDLRSPFNGFLGLTQVMKENFLNLSLTDLVDNIKLLNESAKNLFQLLENLLDWAQLQKGSLPFNPQELNLAETVLRSIQGINQRAILKGIIITNEVSETQKVFADEKMVDCVMRNLLSNAVKFTKREGTVTISSKMAENSMVEISVTDTGVGMPREDVNRLFKANEKVSSPGTENEPSTGLGLLLCSEFVEKNRGTIRVESVVDRGTVFSFTLPLH